MELLLMSAGGHLFLRSESNPVGVIFQARFQAPALNEGGGFGRQLPLNKGGGFGAAAPPVKGGGFGQLSLKSKTPPLIEGGVSKRPLWAHDHVRRRRVGCEV